MSRATILAAAAILVAVPVVAVTSGALDWISGDSASAALFAEDVRLAPPGVSSDPTEEGAAADLGVAGGPLDCPPAGAGPEDSELLFQRQGERFWVTGTVSSFDGATIVVAGPTGDISAALAPEFRLVGDLSPGSAVQMTGTAASDGSMTALEVRSVCPGAGVIDCATGDDPSFELRIQGDTFEVTGRLESLTNDTISVVGPGLVVQIARDAGTTVEGGVDTGDPVRVEGTVGDAQQLRALAVALRCEEALTPEPSPAPSPAASPAVREVQQQTDGCNSGNGRAAGAVRFEVEDDGEAEIKRGAVSANNGTSLTVETPRGPVTVILDEDTEVKGDLASAAAVTVKGDLQDDNSILANEVKALCPDGEEQNRGEGDEDDDDGDGNRGGGNGNGGGRGGDEGDDGEEGGGEGDD
jgi:Domain of unknown function (DUF5666)